MHPGCDVGVGVEGGGDVCVAESFLDDLGLGAVAESPLCAVFPSDSGVHMCRYVRDARLKECKPPRTDRRPAVRDYGPIMLERVKQ